jgi:hypothetical protein
MMNGRENQKYKTQCNFETSWIYEPEFDYVLVFVVDFVTGPIFSSNTSLVGERTFSIVLPTRTTFSIHTRRFESYCALPQPNT